MSKVLPQRFGKYILMRRIAVGGMAEIFKAKVMGTEGFEKELVIKRILPHFSEDESFVKMFIDEATITAKLQHQNIVQIFDFDVVDGAYYIAMECIDGRDLKDVLERSIEVRDPLSVAQCVWILMEVAKGLHYAHAKDYRGTPLNIVHRDISPSNVMVAFNGEVKLMDFGIAKAAQRSTKTMAGAVKGKVAYMSPEQARGKPLDGRSDLFALGIMLWEMLTGKRLFLANSDFETLTNVLKATPPPPSRLNATVPLDLDPIVLKCLSKKAEDRYPNVEAFNRELTRWYYSNVIDLEKERLRPLLARLFRAEIKELERQNAEERVTISGETPMVVAVEPLAPTGMSDATVMISAASDPDAPTDGEERTRLNNATMVDRQQAEPALPMAEERTLALPAVDDSGRPRTQTATRPRSSTPEDTPPRRSRGLWLALLGALLIGGGGAAIYAASSSSDPDHDPTTETRAPATATLSVVVDPSSAAVTIDGETTRRRDGLALGQSVLVRAEAPGFEPWGELVRLAERDQILTIQLARVARSHAVTIRPSDAAAVVYTNGERLGVGSQRYEGRVGEAILVRVEPSGGGEAVTQTITLSEAVDLVDIAVATPTEVTLTVSPATATVDTSDGEIEARGGGVFVIRRLEVGGSIDFTVSANGYRTERRTLGLTQPSETMRIALERVAVAKGSVVVHAKPWAEVAVNGKPQGTTPLTLEIDAGRHRITLTQGTRTVTKNVTVPAGGSANVFHDFSGM